jgi:hypothetical protein
MFAELVVLATAIMVWIAFTEDRPDVIVVKKYYQTSPVPKDIEMSELPANKLSKSS